MLFPAPVLRNRALEVLQLVAGQQANLLERSKVLLRARQVACHEECLADVLVGATMARVELDRAPVVLESELVLLQVAVGKAEAVLQVRMVGLAHFRALEQAGGILPVLHLARPLARSVVRIAGGEIRISFVGSGTGHRGESHDGRAHQARTNECGEFVHRCANAFALASSGRAVSASLASATSLW